MKMTFGERLAYSRKQKKISQQELGKQSGVNGDIVGKYERDEMKPSIKTAKKLANALSISLDYLVGDGEIKVYDKKMLNRIEEINKMPEGLKEKILYFIDMSIRDFKAKQAYTQ